MNFKQRAYSLEVKDNDIDETGTFEGYLSVFDVVDTYNERVMRGAFSKTLSNWAKRGRLPPLLWQHRSGEPIGPFTMMREDDRGLFVRAQLLIKEVQRASEAYALLRSRTISGMSIGFNVPQGGDDYDSKSGIVSLNEVDLWEGSLATFPANVAAEVESVKSYELLEVRATIEAGGLPNPRQFEHLMREVFKFKKDHAKALAGCVASLRREVEEIQKAEPTQSFTSVRLVSDAVKSFESLESLLRKQTP